MALTFGVTKTVFGVTNRNHEGEMRQPLYDEPLAVLLERELMNRYGPIVSNDNLRLVLGYALAMACICTRIGFAPHIRSQQDDSR